MNPVFRWNGEYYGFISNGNLFNASGEYRGWIEDDGNVWREDGTYLGELVEGSYILRNTMKVEPVPRVPRVPPVPPVPMVPAINRVGRVPRVGYEDPLETMN